jgi:hypothetical protein
MQKYIYEYWVHVPTNELWAVALEKDVVVMACGPLDARDTVSSILPHLPYEVRDAGWIQTARSAFRRVVLA